MNITLNIPLDVVNAALVALNQQAQLCGNAAATIQQQAAAQLAGQAPEPEAPPV